jgi:pantoate kinase
LKKIRVDLTGPQGNAFCLMSLARRLSERLGFDTNAIIEEMQKSDYENLVQVFDKHFGEVVILER